MRMLIRNTTTLQMQASPRHHLWGSQSRSTASPGVLTHGGSSPERDARPSRPSLAKRKRESDMDDRRARRETADPRPLAITCTACRSRKISGLGGDFADGRMRQYQAEL